MFSFLLLTPDPKAIIAGLVAQGIAKLDQNTGKLVGARSGFDYAPVPNPIVVSYTTGTGPDGKSTQVPVMDTRTLVLVRVSCESADAQMAKATPVDAKATASTQTDFARSAIGIWAAANGKKETLASADGWSVTAWHVVFNSVDVWLLDGSADPHLPQWQ